MKLPHSLRYLLGPLALATAAAMAPLPAGAAQTDISQVPLGTASSTAVLPNLMFILDDSGSMGWNRMPDNVNASNTCKSYARNSGGSTSTNCTLDNGTDLVNPSSDNVRHVPVNNWQVGPPGFAAQFNTMYYNPQITYSPGKDGAGANLPSFGSPWTAVKINPYVSTATFDLTTQYPEPVFCTASNSTENSATACRRNGYGSDATTQFTTLLPSFRYSTASSPNDGSFGWPISTASGAFRFVRMRFGGPYYYTILPREHCIDLNLSSCILSATPSAFNTVPAPVRYCQTSTLANQTAAVSGTTGSTPSCQAKLDSSHQFLRYGDFVRTDIVSSVATYGNRPNRTDCAARPVCTYDEEMTNFANWYAYYHTRMQTMKTSAGRVFANMDDRYRIGFVTINASGASKYLKIDKFDSTQKTSWYATFYAQTPSSGTPLRQALSRVGRHYAGKTDGINAFMPDDPIQFSCQQNFALLTTDGYWNGAGGVKDDGTTAMDNQDNVADTAPPIYVSRPTVTLDAMGIAVTTTTRVTQVEQVVCTRNNTANFSGSPDTSCGCPTGSPTRRRVKQRTRDMDEVVVATDGVTGPTTYNNPGSSTFQDITACTTSSVTAAATTYTPTGASPTTTSAAGGFPNTLADVAMYYYKTDLRTSGATSITKNNVPTTTKDPASHQHMVTFTLGLGLDGLMNYRPDYETATSGDFNAIRTGATGCVWTAGTCNWPEPIADAPSALDDLWHAAVNGRGIYFSAKDPTALQSGLTTALSTIKVATGAAASSATSTPNITPTDNLIYSSTYRTVFWDGEVVAERIDTVTGEIIPGAVWSASAKLDARVSAASDTRKIFTLDPTDASDRLKPFLYANLTSTEAAFFDNRCGTSIPPDPPPGTVDWPQCGAMSAADLAVANDGNNLVNWLRGQTLFEATHYRDREHALGDTVNAKPVFVAKPILLYGDAVTPDYNSYKSGPAATRTPTLYISSNEGMLHAFDGSDTVNGGDELWAYVPKMLLPELFRLAANNYDVNHRYYVDGSPAAMDVFMGGAWKTIVVGGLNAGGRGFYALDVTDPSPTGVKALWEICSDATVCAISDPDIGFSYGQPVITKRPSDGKWVVIVTSGYNNVSPGDGGGYLYVLDAETGAILHKVATAVSGVNVGDTTTPSGFAKIAGFATNFAVNNTTTVVYGGDLLGNVWRFDMATLPAYPTIGSAQRIAQLKDASSPPKPQSITTRPEITRFDAGFNVLYVATGRFIGVTDLPDPATLTPPLDLAYQQSVYAFKDTGADLGNLRLPAANLVEQDLIVLDSTTRSITNRTVTWSTNNGWFVDLNPNNESPGERVNIDMLLVRGVLLVAANEPNTEACSTGGNSFFYQFDYQSGSYVASAPGGVVGTKLSSALAAGFVVYRLPSGQLKFTEINVNSVKKTGGVNPGSGGSLGKRVSWRELML